MATWTEFSNMHHQYGDIFKTKNFTETASAKPVTLVGIILSSDYDTLTFSHLGRRFIIDVDDVLDVGSTDQAIYNPFNKGISVALTVKDTAQLRAFGEYSVKDLMSDLPFALDRPSHLGKKQSMPALTDSEIVWYEKNGFNIDDLLNTSSSGTYCGHNTNSPKTTKSTSDGSWDDSESDESHGDDAEHDD